MLWNITIYQNFTSNSHPYSLSFFYFFFSLPPSPPPPLLILLLFLLFFIIIIIFFLDNPLNPVSHAHVCLCVVPSTGTQESYQWLYLFKRFILPNSNSQLPVLHWGSFLYEVCVFVVHKCVCADVLTHAYSQRSVRTSSDFFFTMPFS